MESIRNVCVYCGSSVGAEPRFADAADALGQALAKADVGLVFGGGGDGLMGRLARATLAAGGRVTGIIPKFLVKREHALVGAQEFVVVDGMHQRKQLMFEREQLTWAQLQRHRKPVLLADIDGFWRPLLALFAHMRNLGFIREDFEVRYLVAEKIEDALPMLRAAARRLAAPAA